MNTILEKIRGKRVLVVGDVMLDGYIHGRVTRISPEAPVPVVAVEAREYRAGGAANVALNVVALGARAELVGACGRDESRERLLSILEARGIGHEGIVAKDGVPTIFKERIVAHGDHQICRLDHEAAPGGYHLEGSAMEELLRRKVAESDAVIVSDYAKGVVTEALLKTVSAEAKRKKIPVLLDPKPKNKINFKGWVDVITPNRKEALELAGMDGATLPFPAEAVCAALHEQYALEHLVVTMSEEGFLLSSRRGERRQVPTYAQRVSDVTGAGDTFVAALGCALAGGCALAEAAELANMASGVVVAKPGTAVATPEEVVEHAAVMAVRNSSR